VPSQIDTGNERELKHGRDESVSPQRDDCKREERHYADGVRLGKDKSRQVVSAKKIGAKRGESWP